ncbi:MAG: GDSL-type esterase/lipase family protein [Crocinitomicaceae bacterium]|nr:GDSL-type esterase/lipase family protein [Crocinitomicaceae bacterium]
MKLTRTLFILAISLLAKNISAQCTEEDERRILLIGDSWAFFMNQDQTFNNVADQYGHSNRVYHTVEDLAVNGARTEDFLTPASKDLLEAELLANPTINVVHVSLGGNDFLGNWKVSFTPAETEALKLETKDELEELFDHIWSIRPDIKIVYSGYMYANFEEVIEDSGLGALHPFYGTWEGMEFPTFEQLNNILNEFAADMISMASADSRLEYYHAPALMQYHFGQDTPLTVDPFGSYPPFSQPLPEGDVTYPSPKETMRNYAIFVDCFHLSAEGYNVMIGYQFEKFYQKFLMDDIYLLSDVASETGTLTLTGGLSDTTLVIGDSGGNVHAGVLSFNTTLIADTSIAAASIFLHRDSIQFGNPVGETFNLRMKTGFFGTSADLETEDFDDLGDITGVACAFGESDDDGDWVRIDLPEEFLPLISNAEETQFFITISGATNELVYYSSHTDPDYAPVLNIRYKYQFAGVEEMELKEDLGIYPNPTSNQLNLILPNDFKGIISIVSITGEEVISTYDWTNGIDVSHLASGSYIITAIGDQKSYQGEFIKE